jgi:hypothetical protein
VTLIDGATLSDADTRCVAEVSDSQTAGGGATRIKLHDKLAALGKLADRFGITPELVARLFPQLDAKQTEARVLAILRDARARREATTQPSCERSPEGQRQ